jgi:hypothetical protein
MVANSNFTKAKAAKNDEFYTQYADIEREINAYLEYDADVFRGKIVFLPCDDPEWSNFTRYFAQNFDRLGLRKLISTSYAPRSKADLFDYVPSGIEQESDRFDAKKTLTRGKIFVITDDRNLDGKIDLNDLTWDYLEGDGDFRSEEVTRLRDEADIIITNPPFSLFRDYMAWIMDGGKQFVVIANKNCITYKEIFPLIRNNLMWSGNGFRAGNAYFRTPHDATAYSQGVFDETTGLVKFRNVDWFTNIEHGRRHQPLQLMSMADNLKFNKKLKGKTAYDRYEHYDAIDVPFTDAIPSDYDGAMGVPISFLDKYCPEQFEILNANDFRTSDAVRAKPHGLIKDKDGTVVGDPKPRYARILIRSIR